MYGCRVPGIRGPALRAQRAGAWRVQRAVGEVPVVPRLGLVVPVVIRERSESRLALGAEDQARAEPVECRAMPGAVGVHERALAGQRVHYLFQVFDGDFDVSGPGAGTGRSPRRPQVGAVKARDPPERLLRVSPKPGQSEVVVLQNIRIDAEVVRSHPDRVGNRLDLPPRDLYVRFAIAHDPFPEQLGQGVLPKIVSRPDSEVRALRAGNVRALGAQVDGDRVPRQARSDLVGSGSRLRIGGDRSGTPRARSPSGRDPTPRSQPQNVQDTVDPVAPARPDHPSVPFVRAVLALLQIDGPAVREVDRHRPGLEARAPATVPQREHVLVVSAPHRVAVTDLRAVEEIRSILQALDREDRAGLPSRHLQDHGDELRGPRVAPQCQLVPVTGRRLVHAAGPDLSRA